MIKGTYIFYENGEEILRSSNLITKFGKRFLTNFLAGNVSFSKKNMALGIANSNEYALSDSNSRLGFEFYRMPVEFGTTNIQSNGLGGYTYSVIYKSTIPQEVSGIINEIGIYPDATLSENFYDSKFISDFENNLLWKDSANTYPSIIESVNQYTPRVGKYLIGITANSGSPKEYFANVNSLDISGYSVKDSLTIALYQSDTNLSSVKIRFYSSDTDYYEAIFSSTPDIGSYILSTDLNNMLLNPTGTPNSASINKIGVCVESVSGDTTVYLDGLRINDEDTFDPSYGLISRSIISGGLEKISGRQVDVEYRLELF